MTDTAPIGHNRQLSPEEALLELIEDLGGFSHDWLGFVMWAFPWGEPGTPLENETGPDVWQCDQLNSISEGLARGDFKPIREAVASGHGIGKSALVCFIILAALMTYPDMRGVVTANTDTQLKTKTWAELAKWDGMIKFPLLKDQFKLTATAIYSTQEGHEKTWRIDAIPWSKSNPAAFAGAHNAGKRLLMIMDEASEIVDVIWDTVEGAMTDVDTELVLCVYGNPTKPTGRFKEVVAGRLRGDWTAKQIDSRTVKRTNKATLQSWIDTWGEDSDFVRIRVTGQFPRVGMTQLIPSELITAARKRTTGYNPSDPLILGVDVARYGNDATVLAPRRGNDAKTIPWQRYRGKDTMFVASEIALFHQQHHTDAIMVDIGGVGAGVYDRLIQLQVPNVYPVDFGGAGGFSDYNGMKIAVANKRAAMWVSVREWLRIAGAIPSDMEVGRELETDLSEVQYSFAKQTQILLESKEHMRERGVGSPDHGDALACTFAYPVAARAIANPYGVNDPRRSEALLQGQNGLPETDYDIHRDLKDW